MALLPLELRGQEDPFAEVSAPPIVERVKLRGVRAGRRDGLRTRMQFEAGQPLDEWAVEQARLRLLATGLFEWVEAHLEKGSERGRVVLVMQVRERPTTSLDAIHLGHAAPTELWGGLEVSDLDPLGQGFGVGAGFVTSGKQTSTALAFRIPNKFPELEVGFTARYIDGQEPFVGPRGQRVDGVEVRQIEVPYTRLGGDLEVVIRTSDLGRLKLITRLETLSGDAPANAEQQDPDDSWRRFDFDLPRADILASQDIGFEFDRRNDPAFPTSGFRAAMNARLGVAGEPYSQLFAGFEQYLQLPLRHVLRVDARAGVVFGQAPFFERFFIGDLHTYIPERAMGVNFARRRGPSFLGGPIREQRYETLAGRAGLEYRIPLGRGLGQELYGVELFIGGALISLSTPDEVSGAPVDATLDFGIRLESDIGVMGLSVGNLFLLVDP